MLDIRNTKICYRGLKCPCWLSSALQNCFKIPPSRHFHLGTWTVLAMCMFCGPTKLRTPCLKRHVKSAILVWSFFLFFFFSRNSSLTNYPCGFFSGCYQIWNMHTKWKQFFRRSRGCVPCMLNSSSLKLQAPLTAPFQPPRCPPTIKALIPLYQIINGREMQITFPALLTFFFFF